ncbi:glycoside hydrolase family 31 protein [Paenibacillus albus]|uniref:Glycoside hydrolase n=1 Tax=Paenibacillus albus TaxID=2495582 RepID=A0A3Q8X6T4_9BACL|nr:glycoside hydrolase family 31 protein [Paenibacillus albus]AZN40999.1 glycoside hydrolase [Paenibacillus albus]
MNKWIEFDLLPGEVWWGGAVHDGPRMPYGQQTEAPVGADLRNLLENSGAPLLVSNRGRYVWLHRPFTFQFQTGRLKLETEGEFDQLDPLEEGHGDLKGAYLHASRNYFPAQGRMPDPMAFTTPQYCTWMEMHYEPTQEKTIAYAREIIRNGFPPGVLIIDDNWMKDYGTWEFHAERFPDPKQMIDTLHEMGFKIMLWVCPYVSPDSQTARALAKQGLLVQDAEGRTALRRWWNGCSAVLDYTYSPALAWFKEKLDLLVQRYGVDGFKFDAGDPTGNDPEAWVTSYTWRSSNVPNEDCAAYSTLGQHYPLSEYRASWKAGGAPLMQRLRDKPHSWGKDGLNSLIPNAIAQGLMGYPFNCPDMVGGGWDGDLQATPFDAELFVRYAQCAALFPMMQFSTAPWNVLDASHLEYCQAAVRLRTELGPEIAKLAEHAGTTGEPVLRPMAYEFPNHNWETVSDQFMLGSSIMVAPVLEKGAEERIVRFPEGAWRGQDGTLVTGPCTITAAAPLSTLPWYRLEK